ncbi:MAG: ABC transporter substrate-binding protein, partial [Mariprofundales bacterium]|nr:ABC transporter substrate-binding protein [Mariprofundales bacterium]
MSRLSLILLWCLLPIYGYAANAQISLQLKWKHQFQFAGYYMALEKGYYRDAGLDVTLIEGGPGRSAVEHVVNEQAAYGITSTGALIECSRGKAVRVVGAIFQHSPLVLLVKKSSTVKTLADLRGKRIMLQQGYQNAGIVAALKEVGVYEKDFIRQDISYDIHDLTAGRTDAFAAYLTDQPHQLKLLGVPYRIFYPKDHGVDFYGDIVITSDAEISNHPQRVRAFMQATARGWNDALEHIDEAIDLILLKYNTQHLPREQLLFEARESAKLIMHDVVNIGYMNNYRWQRIAQTYAAQGLLPANYPVSAFLYQPEPFMVEVIRNNLWWLGLLLLALLALHIVILHRTVRYKTKALESERKILLAGERFD